jgi:hypothetical protein
MLRRTSRVAVYVASLFLFWLIAAPNAHAYIDPGSSSFIIQILIGAAAGSALAIATFWRRIRSFLVRVFGKKKETTMEPPSTDGT